MTVQYKQLKNDIRKYLSGARYGAKGAADPWMLSRHPSKDFVSTHIQNKTFAKLMDGK